MSKLRILSLSLAMLLSSSFAHSMDTIQKYKKALTATAGIAVVGALVYKWYSDHQKEIKAKQDIEAVSQLAIAQQQQEAVRLQTEAAAAKAKKANEDVFEDAMKAFQSNKAARPENRIKIEKELDKSIANSWNAILNPPVPTSVNPTPVVTQPVVEQPKVATKKVKASLTEEQWKLFLEHLVQINRKSLKIAADSNVYMIQNGNGRLSTAECRFDVYKKFVDNGSISDFLEIL